LKGRLKNNHFKAPLLTSFHLRTYCRIQSFENVRVLLTKFEAQSRGSTPFSSKQLVVAAAENVRLKVLSAAQDPIHFT